MDFARNQRYTSSLGLTVRKNREFYARGNYRELNYTLVISAAFPRLISAIRSFDVGFSFTACVMRARVIIRR
jgi:large-conductance mechanosensitive channel